MQVIIEPVTENDPQIYEVCLKTADREYKATWLFKNINNGGCGFFIIGQAYDRNDVDVYQYLKTVLEKEKSETSLYINEGNLFVRQLLRGNYNNTGNTVMKTNDMHTAMTINIIAYKKDAEQITVYRQDITKNNSNKCILQHRITYTARSRKGIWNMLFPKTIIKFKVKENLFPGLLYYSTDKKRFRYPITDEMLDGFSIKNSASAHVEVKIFDKYKDYFKCAKEI